MSKDEEFEDEAEVELEDVPDADAVELEEEDLDEDIVDDDLVPEVLDDDLGDDLEAAVDGEAAVAKPARAKTAEAPEEASEGGDEDDDAMELDEELHPDDVEEPLDVLLQERTASAKLEDEEEELEDELDDALDDRGDGPTKIVPRRPGEFLCSSCFLVLPRSQLADPKRMLCRDCA